ncbi:hypothetical protein [Paenibacillus harenae]|uniref:hypothetical protein n=1 Tax=Paenibacillus harenae TaxID=306543 RepID=UPI00040718CD|nr:hypothetical protein [Paenibacillus harenae]
MKAAAKHPLSLTPLAQGATELFFFLPVLLTATIYFLPPHAVWAWIATLPLCYWLASAILELRPKLRLFIRLLLAVAIGAVHAILIIFITVGGLPPIAVIICAFFGTITSMRGMSMKLRGWAESFPNSYLLVGIVIYAAAQLLKLFAFQRLADYNGALLLCGIASVILFFFFANERHLNSETVDNAKSQATLAFKRQNRLLMAVIVVIITILALFRQIQQTIEGFFRSIVQKLMAWLNRPGGQETIEEPPVSQAPPDMPGAEAPKPPAEWMVVLEQILKIFGIALVIIVACIALFLLSRKLYQWAKRFMAKLMERGDALRKGDAGFTDEVEQLMTLTSWRKQIGDQLQKLIPKKKYNVTWDDLKSNADRIRFLYSYLIRSDMKRGQSFEAHLTPRETGAIMSNRKENGMQRSGISSFIDAYEQVRYGEKSIEDEQVSAFKVKLYKEEK